MTGVQSRDFIAHEAAQAPLPQGSPRPWWESRAYALFLILVSTIPLLLPAFPPLVDLPSHMGRYRVALDIGRVPQFGEWFSYQWVPIGNLGVDVLVHALAPLMGVVAATKAVVILIPPLTVAGMLLVAREVHNRLPPTAAFAVPLAYCHPFLFGFVNFALSMALALLAMGFWLRMGRLGAKRLRAALFVPISFIVFFTHAFGWGTMGLLIVSAEFIRQHDRGRHLVTSGLRAAYHSLAMALPLLVMALWRSDAGGGRTVGFFGWRHKGDYVLQILRDRWEAWDIAGVVVLLGLLVFAALHRKLTLSRNLMLSALALGIAYVLLPRMVFGSAYADMRLAPYVLIVSLLAIRFRFETDMVLARRLAIAGLAFLFARLAVLTASLAIAGQHQARQLSVLESVRPGSVVVGMTMAPCKGWAMRRSDHLASMAIVERDAFANDQWPLEGSALLNVHVPELMWFQNDPSQMARYPACPSEGRSPRLLARALEYVIVLKGAKVDYLWLLDFDKGDPSWFEGWHVVDRAEGSILLARDAAP